MDAPQIFVRRYFMVRPIGRGGMGEVFEAFDPRVGRRVAIKKLAPHLRRPELAQRLVAEARTAASILHPCIVTILDAAAYGEEPHLVMEYLQGETLGALLQREGKLRPARALALLQPVAEALDLAHRQGIEHRDLKPDNLFVITDGAGERLKLLDFGIARDRGPAAQAKANTQGSGTPHYAAPEQFERGALIVPGRGDVFSLGVVLYQALAGRLPFEIGAASVRDRRPRSLRTIDRGIVRPLADLCDRMLHSDPAARPTMTQVADALRQLQVTTPPVPAWQWWALGGAGGFLAALVALLWPKPVIVDLYTSARAVLQAEFHVALPAGRSAG